MPIDIELTAEQVEEIRAILTEANDLATDERQLLNGLLEMAQNHPTGPQPGLALYESTLTEVKLYRSTESDVDHGLFGASEATIASNRGSPRNGSHCGCKRS